MPPGQFDLFSEHPLAAPDDGAMAGAVAPAEPGRDVVALGQRLPPELRLGTSSWSFPGWSGLVYRQTYRESLLARSGLAAYARHPLLRSVGLDRTFYAPLAEADYRRYAEAVPTGFCFLVKAPMSVTAFEFFDRRRGRAHANAAFMDAEAAVRAFVGPAVRGLGDRLGPLVFQFPPLGEAIVADPTGFARRLGDFLGRLPKGPTYAVELRNRELLTRPYAAALDAGGATHCVAIHPRMPTAAAQARIVHALVAGPLVVRWSLHRGYTYEEAKTRFRPFSRLVDRDPDTRRALARLATEVLRAGRPAWVVANNKAEGSAPLTLEAFAAEVDALLADGDGSDGHDAGGEPGH